MDKVFYELILKNSPMAFAFHKIVLDEAGVPCDFIFLQVNQAFEEMTGLVGDQIIGKCVTEAIPGIKEDTFDYIAAYGKTALQGGTAEYEQYSDALGRWYRIQVYSPEKYYFAVNFLDISKEKHQLSEHEKLMEQLRENELQFHRIIDSLPFSLTISRSDGSILYINTEGMKLFELSGDVIDQKSTIPLWVNSEDRLSFLNAMDEKGRVQDFEMHLVTKKGRRFWARASSIIINYQNQRCMLTSHHDFTERKKMEIALRTSEEKYRLIAEFASDMIWVFNYTNYKFTYVSPSVFQILGYLPEEVLRLDLSELISEEFLQQSEEMLTQKVKDFLESPDSVSPQIMEMQNIHKNGQSVWMESALKYRYNSKNEIEIVGVSRNIEERKNTEKKVLYLSYHDQLTGLFNRRFYEEELRRLDTARNLPITLVLADVNGLKLTNDAFGHLAGDELLVRTAEILERECRNDDIIARIGGDEFIILLTRTGKEETDHIISRIKKSLAAERCGNTVLSVSFGSATKQTPEQDMESIFIEAENTMYRRKLNESSSMRNETIKIIKNALYSKSEIEEAHNRNVGKLCGEIAQAMELSEETINEMITAGSLHDIGKIGMDEKMLDKLSPLTEEEWIEYKRHPEKGYQILKASSEFSQVAQYVLCHHERMDGLGYPRGIAGEEIPIQARILSIADSYDSMMNPRGYQETMDEDSVIKKIMENAGTQFDKTVAKAFVEKVLNKPWNQ